MLTGKDRGVAMEIRINRHVAAGTANLSDRSLVRPLISFVWVTRLTSGISVLDGSLEPPLNRR